MNPIEQMSPNPTSHDLAYIERLLLHALRQWVTSRERWPDIVLEFNRTCGPRPASRLCETLESLFHTLGLHARHRVRHYPTACCHVSHDELCLLNLLAAQQNGATLHTEALLRWMVSRVGIRQVRTQTRTIAECLFEAGYTLERRWSGMETRPESPRARRAMH